jgi:hypothetical protein
LACDFATFPIGFAAVADQKIEGRFPWQEWVVLPEVADPQARVVDDFPFFELFLPKEDLEERGFPGPIPPDEADFNVVDQRGLGTLEEDLVSVALVGVSNLNQYCHSFGGGISWSGGRFFKARPQIGG